MRCVRPADVEEVGELRFAGACGKETIAIVPMDVRLGRNQEGRAARHCLRAGIQRVLSANGVSDPACGDDRQHKRGADLPDQRQERRRSLHVASRLHSLGNHAARAGGGCSPRFFRVTYLHENEGPGRACPSNELRVGSP